MPVDFDFWPDSDDLAGAIDDKGGSLNAHIGFAIHCFFDPHTKLFTYIRLMVGNKMAFQVKFCAKFSLFLWRVL
jgi:hypothetical protein